MLQSQAPIIMKISTLFVCLIIVINANPNDNAVESTLSPSSSSSYNKLEAKEGLLTIKGTQQFGSIEAGSTPSLTCSIDDETGEVWWSKNGTNVTSSGDSKIVRTLNIQTANINDSGNYTCFGTTSAAINSSLTVYIRVIEPVKIKGGHGAREKLDSPAILSCDIQGYPLRNITWIKILDSDNTDGLENLTFVNRLNETHLTTGLNFTGVTRKDNGTYECRATDYNNTVISSQRSLVVVEVPQIKIDFTKAVGAGSVYLNWTVTDRNDPVQYYLIQHMKNGTEEFQYYTKQIDGRQSYYVITGLENEKAYKFKITASTSVGKSHPDVSDWVTTLEKDPVFIPTVQVKGTTITSITIGWSAPPPELKEHVHYYKIMATHNETTRESIYPAEVKNIYIFEELEPGTDYILKVAACSYYTQNCSDWSDGQGGRTLDGFASPPKNVSVTCTYDNTTGTGKVFVTWLPPDKPNGLIIRYDVVLTGFAEFKNSSGILDSQNWGPNNKSVDVKKSRITDFEGVPVNTNYTVRISGVTRLRTSSGEEGEGKCRMPRSIPNRESLNARSWRKLDHPEGLFKLSLPRILERNGPICCYRIFIVKLGHRSFIQLPEPKDTIVSTYQQVYDNPMGGAYLAEMYDADQLVPEIFIGDGKTFNGSINCLKCVGLKPKPPTLVIPEDQTTVPSTNITNTTTVLSQPIPTPENHSRQKREDGEDSVSDTEPNHYLPEDGRLDVNANYTGFIEVMVYGDNPDEYNSAYSGYLDQQYAGFVSDDDYGGQSATVGVLMQICIALLVIVLVILMGMCVLHKYLKHARQSGEEIISLRNSFRHLCRTLRGRHQLVASSPPDMPPISRSDLLQAYIDRHRDSDYGFQHEFELLPDRFADRTTRASESRENLYKNRYPDIKCYDQTRVRLAQVDGISGSDYINANFVLGYKERKKFICAQGPMENTVCDYWRMIWEQHLELVLMLTNLEEYSKTKCAKYWPDKTESKSFGDITVEHIRERPYSDYVVRELKMTRTGERDSRIIIQHHFLVWKDFMAPEHPHAILRFIKRVNEAYSLEKGPILVHCSAGVGRTGTLVALDSLLQQLTEEGQVSIFNTVCDLRHQRNFLVQSLKQYIFVYRALMEMAQFGDTEISATQLKNHVDKLRQRENGKDKCKMEEEFEKIHSVLEDRKSFSVGGGDENRLKNRNELVIPYDRNRVILTPVPGREHSTYINASFIEGYDNSESFIITQDPLETTVPDFWRMISEQCASTIVMLSDLSEGPRKCPRYWPDDEVTYDHIRVRYIQSESCPYYTRRELNLLNAKTDENMVVTQYHYHGWPTVEGEVPEVTRGLIELVDQTIANDVESGGPLVVHCSCGSDRSSMFVALSILVQQLRTERRVDIFTTTKKLRSQRHGMIGTFSQYEFLHRAIVNYSDLHNLAEEDAAS